MNIVTWNGSDQLLYEMLTGEKPDLVYSTDIIASRYKFEYDKYLSKPDAIKVKKLIRTKGMMTCQLMATYRKPEDHTVNSANFYYRRYVVLSFNSVHTYITTSIPVWHDMWKGNQDHEDMIVVSKDMKRLFPLFWDGLNG